jgi:class 3 adenylate cyclase
MSARTGLWAAGVALPLIGLWVLLAQPSLDVAWEQHPAHFWIVLAAALASMVLAIMTGDAARERRDARVYLISLAFLTSAGFLGLHALATPGVIVAGKNAGFTIATPVGLALASFFIAASSLLGASPASAEWVMRRRSLLWWSVIAVMAAWAAVSLSGVGPLDRPLAPESTSKPFIALAGIGCVLYGIAAYRYFGLYRRERPLLVLGVVTAFVLLAEAMLAVAFGRNWHATWWEWHALMAAAFLLIFASARVEYARTGSTAATFAPLYISDVDPRFAAAEQELRGGLSVAEVQRRHDLAPEEIAELERALGWTRDLARREEGIAEGDYELTILFADLEGFTSFAEAMPGHDVLRMLNENFEVVVPALREEGARIDKFVGDAVMAEFGLGRERDHALRAARAGLALQRVTTPLSARHPDWPRFRVGINTGVARVGRLGGGDVTVIGDPVNLASRLESRAEAGQVVVGVETYRRLPDGTAAQRLGAVEIKGKAAPVEAYVLVSLPPRGNEGGDRLDDEEDEA